AQLYTQMKRAYDKGAKDCWIVNVGDLKPGEYLTELFLDMAWNINAIKNDINGMDQHLENWLGREFGSLNGQALLRVMNEYYRLAYIRKPELMGATRTEEKDPKYKTVADLPWSEPEIRERLKAYEALSARVAELSKKIPMAKKDTWFQLVEYPVLAAAEMNKKILYGQLARHGKANWAESDKAYDQIEQLTQQYNAVNNGKWKGIMNFKPRALAVFDQLPRIKAEADLASHIPPKFIWNGTDYTAYSGSKPVAHGLGYQRGAVIVPAGTTLNYSFNASVADLLRVELALAPNHPVEGKAIRYAIRINDGQEQIVNYATEGRSEEWKENVLRNQAIRTTSHLLSKKGKQTIYIRALDEGVIVDQVKVW
ncbi:MAG TPA: glycosyl hydrolase 115 family protein, partial [Niabella sp.]|nr:glycosyl hydrolase 115 family protein [Niabella sp.]